MTITLTRRGAPVAVRREPAARAPRPPDPQAWSGTVVRAVVEVLSGTRPLAQLGRWLSPELYETVGRRAGPSGRHRRRHARPVTVRRVHVCRIGEDVVESSVVVHDGTHLRAAAIRLETYRGRWRATALQIG